MPSARPAVLCRWLPSFWLVASLLFLHILFGLDFWHVGSQGLYLWYFYFRLTWIFCFSRLFFFMSCIFFPLMHHSWALALPVLLFLFIMLINLFFPLFFHMEYPSYPPFRMSWGLAAHWLVQSDPYFPSLVSTSFIPSAGSYFGPFLLYTWLRSPSCQHLRDQRGKFYGYCSGVDSAAVEYLLNQRPYDFIDTVVPGDEFYTLLAWMGHPLRRGDPDLSLPISYVTKVVVVSFLRGEVSISERRDGSVSAVSIMGGCSHLSNSSFAPSIIQF